MEHTLRTTLASLSLLAAAWPAHASAAAGLPASQDAVREKLESYLEHRPYHEAAFERFMRHVLEFGALDEVRGAYARRLESDPGDQNARILLARVERSQRRPRRALELLGEITQESPELLRLRAELLIDLHELQQAVELLQRAFELSEDRFTRGELLILKAQSEGQSGNRGAALSSLRAFADLAPADYAQRTEAAARLQQLGLLEGSLQEWHASLKLTDEDPEKRIRSLVEIGHLSERLALAVEAREAYQQAFELTGPGHWRRPALFERLLALYGAAGDLEALVEHSRLAAETHSSDPERRLFLARALDRAGHGGEACALLQRAVVDFPRSLTIGRACAELLVHNGEPQAAAREYARLAAAHPDEAGLHLEAGNLLAIAAGLKQARMHWALEIERSAEDVSVHIQIARALVSHGQYQEAHTLLQDVSRGAPTDLRPIRAMDELLRERGYSASVAALLAQCQALADDAGDADLLENIAFEWLNRDDIARAMRALQAALDALPTRDLNRKRLLISLLALTDEQRDFSLIARTLLGLFDLQHSARGRAESLDLVTTHYQRANRLTLLEYEQRRAHSSDPTALRPLMLLAIAHELQGEHGEADGALERLTSLPGSTEDLLRCRARMAEHRDDLDGAIAHLQQLGQSRPALRSEMLRETARLKRHQGHHEQADALLKQAGEELPGGPQLLAEQVRARRRAHDIGGALELLQQSLRRRPEDNITRLELAALHMRLEQRERALVEIGIVLHSRDPVARQRAVQLLLRSGSSRSAALNLETLSARLSHAPRSVERGLCLAVYALHVGFFETAQGVAAGLLERNPGDFALEHLASSLFGLTSASLTADYRPQLAAGSERAQVVRLARVELARGKKGAALRILKRLDDPLLTANLCLSAGAPKESLDLLQRALRANPEQPQLRVRLTVAHLAAGAVASALQTLSPLTSKPDACWELLLFEGRLHALGQGQVGAKALGSRLQERLSDTLHLATHEARGAILHQRRIGEVFAYYERCDLERQLMADVAQLLEQGREDPWLLEAYLQHCDPGGRSRAAAVLKAAESLAAPPAGWNHDDWRALLDGHRQRLDQPARTTAGSPK